ncbi:MAG: hypothetical protein LBD80_07770 [Tannerella sp.]|jgi:hypothetical protein|nr:hypothetical protein [Tannerella sp.]
MKHVLLTFIGILLLYSLIFNERKSVAPAEKINYLHENSSPVMYFRPDSSLKNTPLIMPYEIMLFASEAH